MPPTASPPGAEGKTDDVSAEDSSEHPHRPRPPRRRSPWVATLVVIVVIIIIGVLLWVPVAATSSSSYCGSCKATEPAAEAWAGSVHSDVDCVECHIAPGAWNQIKWRTREWLNIWADYLNVPQTDQPGERPGDENCTPCHDVSTIGDEHDTVRLPHERHVGISGLVCADCHDKVSHGERADAGKVSMSVCGMCHEQETAANQCDFCHLTPQTPADPHPARLHRDARRGGADGRQRLSALPSQPRGVLRRVSRAADRRPLLRHLAIHSQDGRRAGPQRMPGLSRRRHLLRAVPPREPPRGLAAVPWRGGGRRGLVPDLPPAVDVRRLSRREALR